MNYRRKTSAFLPLALAVNLAMAAPIIDPLPNVSLPAGKSLTIPITAASPNGQPLTYTVTSSTNRITIEHHTNNPFWKMSVVQVAASNTPGAFQTPFRGGLATVTNVGDMTFMLLRDRAPRTVDAIAALSTSGFYNSNTIFHRVALAPYFLIQGGDPNTNGSGGPLFLYDDELHPRSLFSGSGQLGSANAGSADTDGSQFFITAAPDRSFDLRYTIFGQLLRGFNVLSNVLNTAINAGSRPLADVIITRASLVPNTMDTVITLTGTNLVGVAGTILVIADDGVGGRTTNSFTATTVSDSANNAPAILKTPAITNLWIPINVISTNFIQVQDVEGNTIYYHAQFADATSASNATNSNIYTNGALAVAPNPGYTGPIRIRTYTSDDGFATYDLQTVTFAVGDTPITILGTNFVAQPLEPVTNQLLATFTNGIPNSAATSFIALINWGDNSTNSGVILTDAGGRKEVHGSHTYTNSGHYPIYITIKSALGAEATVISTAYVQPSISLTRTGMNNLLRWPAWATDYRLQINTSRSTSNWSMITDFPALVGYETVVTNLSTDSNRFFRLKY